MPSRRAVLAGVSAAFGLTSVSWASTSASINLTVSSEGVTATGRAAEINTINGELREQRGGGTTTHAGDVLYEIDVANGASSQDINIQIDFLNAHEIGKVLNNPNAYLEIGIWYTGSGDHELHNITTGGVPDGTEVSLDSDTETRFSQHNASAVLSPTVDEDPLYVIARVQTPGSAPPGQQPSGEFRFNGRVRSY